MPSLSGMVRSATTTHTSTAGHQRVNADMPEHIRQLLNGPAFPLQELRLVVAQTTPKGIVHIDAKTVVELLRVLTRPGDAVVISPPVYPPFFQHIGFARRRVMEVPLVREGGRWELDFAGLEAAFAAGGVHLVAVPVDYSENKRVLVDEPVAIIVGDRAAARGSPPFQRRSTGMTRSPRERRACPRAASP